MRELIGLPIEDAVELLGNKAYRVINANLKEGEHATLVVGVQQDDKVIKLIVADFKTTVELS